MSCEYAIFADSRYAVILTGVTAYTLWIMREYHQTMIMPFLRIKRPLETTHVPPYLYSTPLLLFLTSFICGWVCHHLDSDLATSGLRTSDLAQCIALVQILCGGGRKDRCRYAASPLCISTYWLWVDSGYPRSDSTLWVGIIIVLYARSVISIKFGYQQADACTSNLNQYSLTYILKTESNAYTDISSSEQAPRTRA